MQRFGKYIGYALIIFAGWMGFVSFNPRYLIFLALISALIFASSRRKDLKSTPMAPDQNMIVDGLFLFALQGMLMFTAYLLGYFASSAGGDLFGEFLRGGR
ncbi:MAG: hypothetical protein ABJG88_04055 [Litorimonas sp.]